MNVSVYKPSCLFDLFWKLLKMNIQLLIIPRVDFSYLLFPQNKKHEKTYYCLHRRRNDHFYMADTIMDRFKYAWVQPGVYSETGQHHGIFKYPVLRRWGVPVTKLSERYPLRRNAENDARAGRETLDADSVPQRAECKNGC